MHSEPTILLFFVSSRTIGIKWKEYNNTRTNLYWDNICVVKRGHVVWQFDRYLSNGKEDPKHSGSALVSLKLFTRYNKNKGSKKKCTNRSILCSCAFWNYILYYDKYRQFNNILLLTHTNVLNLILLKI